MYRNESGSLKECGQLKEHGKRKEQGSLKECEYHKEHGYRKEHGYSKECEYHKENGYRKEHGYSKECGYCKEHKYRRMCGHRKGRGYCKVCVYCKERGAAKSAGAAKSTGVAGHVGTAQVAGTATTSAKSALAASPGSTGTKKKGSNSARTSRKKRGSDSGIPAVPEGTGPTTWSSAAMMVGASTSLGTSCGHLIGDCYRSESTSSFGAATAVDCTTSRARVQMPPNAALKSNGGTLGQTTVVRHTQATSLQPTYPFGPDPFDELLVFGRVDLMEDVDEDIPCGQQDTMEWLLKLADSLSDKPTGFHSLS